MVSIKPDCFCNYSTHILSLTHAHTKFVFLMNVIISQKNSNCIYHKYASIIEEIVKIHHSLPQERKQNNKWE